MRCKIELTEDQLLLLLTIVEAKVEDEEERLAVMEESPIYTDAILALQHRILQTTLEISQLLAKAQK